MIPRIPHRGRVRAGLRVLALALAAGACERALPTDAEVQRMDVAALEARSAVLRPSNPAPTGGLPQATYFVDGRPVPAEEARRLTGERIVRMVMGRAPEGGSVVRIYTAPTTDAAVRAPEAEGAVRFRPDEAPPLYATSNVGSSEVRMTTPERFSGLLVVDGVVTDRAGLARLGPDDIAQVEIIKGAAAVRTYTDPRARNGVISITTVSRSR